MSLRIKTDTVNGKGEVVLRPGPMRGHEITLTIIQGNGTQATTCLGALEVEALLSGLKAAMKR